MNSQVFLNKVREFLPWSQTHTGEAQARILSVDASPFEPQAFAVIDVFSLDELKAILFLAAECGVSLTFLGSGTSLSGQSVAEGAALRFKGSAWRGLDILEEGRFIRVRSAMLGGEVNAALAPFRRFLAADPSSIASATVGGMAANNAAGLGCTVENNIYHSLRGMTFMLADGTLVNTENVESVRLFRSSHADLLNGLRSLRERILSSPSLAERVRRKYRIRNTCGYSLNALCDFEDPLDMLTHILIGSEGTLGFIFSVTLETLPIEKERATAMVLFSSMDAAMLEMRFGHGLYAGEFLDDISLRSLAMIPGFPSSLMPGGGSSDNCALLVETRAATKTVLGEHVSALNAIIKKAQPLAMLGFVTEVSECEKLWDIRRALFPALAGTRMPEEYAYVEDYCVPLEHLPKASRGLARILQELGFSRSGVNGHAMHGNLHCTVPLCLSNDDDVKRLGAFIERATQLILDLDGSLKAEHGTGRAVASFVLREWGEELYDVMRSIKALFDPAGILNRNCLLNDRHFCHLERLKSVGVVGGGVDLCVDCGFCEPICPSAKVGFSPRQRIYALRVMAGMKKSGDTARLAAWMEYFHDMGLDLCAADGLCSTRCPLGLDVAGFMRALRHENLSEGRKKTAALVRKNFAPVTRALSFGLSATHTLHGVLGHTRAEKCGSLTGKLLGLTLPDFKEVLLTGGSRVPLPAHDIGLEKVVYFPSCAVRSMGYGAEAGRKVEPLMNVALRLLEKAGYDVVIPAHVEKLCCGKAFETKGMEEEAAAFAATLDAALIDASEGGKWPVMCDTSPCLARMRKTLSGALSLYEPVEFTLRFLVDRLYFQKKRGCVAVHATCSTRAMGLADALCRVAGMCAREVVLPEGVFCCGFSGDKGFTRPELNAAALAGLVERIAACEEGFSTSRTCEIGLTKHGKKPYRNILYLIDECSVARR